MFVTLDVSRLSGWLNTESCRVEKWGVYDRRARCGSGHTTAVGMRRAQEHTTNILLMSVTLDVSSVSGWLNAGT